MDEEQIFLGAVEIESSLEREAFLNTACGADHALRERVEALLQSHKHEGFLNPPETVLTPEQSAIDLLVPEGSEVSYFGNYEVLGVVARGGMGVVYKARQVNLDRIVALKMMLAGRLASPDEIQRFRTEAEAAARLDHPHIVPVHEVGEHNGLQYFSMTFVDGQSLAGKLDDGPLTPHDAAQLMEQIADAVDYAHEQSVLLLGLSVTIPLLRSSGSLFGHSYDFPVSLLEESPGTSGILLTMTCAGCVLVGKGLLRGLVAPASVALIGMTFFLFSSEHADKLVTPAGAIAVYGSICLLMAVAVAVRGGVRPECPGSLSETGSEMVPPDPARGAFLLSSLFWIQLILYLSQVEEFPGSVFLAASVAAGVSLLEGAGVLRTSGGKPKTAFGFVVIRSGQAAASPKPAVRWILITILALFSLAAVVIDYWFLREGLENLSRGFALLSLGMLQVWSARLLRALSPGRLVAAFRGS
ncbi:MAG TPA: serine/threonine protein kinase [Planctomycetes bacterium]|nr:serine/threonine protein kinase [Fuerstiella sp.]HIK91442.1 serine/threonine protein kinase [Planctomycetota bacterium]